MIDIGVNLLSGQFDSDRAAVLGRASAAGVEGMIITASDLAESTAAAAYCAAACAARGADNSPLLAATAGIHPHSANRQTAADITAATAELAELAQQPAVVAIGETGLDYFRDFAAPEDQRIVCQAQLALAAGLNMPVFAHDRDAAPDLVRLIESSGINPATVVVHCFTGTTEALQRYLEMGCMIGITGWVCDRKRGAALRHQVKSIPLDRLLIETDAPYLRPHSAPKQTLPGATGRRNEPALLPYVVTMLAQCMDLPVDQLVTETRDNALRVFPRLQSIFKERESLQ